MMEPPYRTAIETNRGRLTEAYAKVADYILDHYVEVAFMRTLDELSEEVGIDPSSIVRFAKFIGYRGWPHLHRDIMNNVHLECLSGNPGIQIHADAHRAVLEYDQFTHTRTDFSDPDFMAERANLYRRMVTLARALVPNS